jgi:hypothetical protein
VREVVDGVALGEGVQVDTARGVIRVYVQAAARSEPAPLSSRLVTMKVLGRQRSSRASTPSRGVRGRWGKRRNVATDGRDFKDLRNERNHMVVSFAMRSAIE